MPHRSLRARARALRRLAALAAARASAERDDRDARTLVDALPRDVTFSQFVERAFELGETDAAAFVEAFCASERLTLTFCEQAFECAYGAHARDAPEEELQTYVTLARIFLSSFRSRVLSREAVMIDDVVADARRRLAAASSPDAVESVRDDIRRTLSRAFTDDRTLDFKVFLTRLRAFRVKLARDDERNSSFALDFFDADEAFVAALVDPDDELRCSARTRGELIAAVDCVVDASRDIFYSIDGSSIANSR